MCAATDTYDISLAAIGIDICESMFDSDPADKQAQQKLDFTHTFAFKNFELNTDPNAYEFSNIDATETRKVLRDNDYFTLFDFSAKWDPIPAMLCQNHRNLIKGFMEQTTAYRKEVLKPGSLVMVENKSANKARYIHGERGKGFWNFYDGQNHGDYRYWVVSLPLK